MISHKHKCIFIHIPKCAGTSIESAFGHRDGLSGRGLQDHRTLRMIENPLASPYVLASMENLFQVLHRVRHHFGNVANPNSKHMVTRQQYESYFKFTFVRNPWWRACSWYDNVMRDEIHQNVLGVNGSISFTEFIRRFAGKGMLRPQTYWMKDFRGEIPLDFIGRFENLEADFSEVCTRLRIGSVSLPHKIKGRGKDYRDFYETESIRIVQDVYREEIELFGYSFS